MSSDQNGPTSHAPGLTAMPDVLVTVSHEVRLLADTAAELQNVIGNLLMTERAPGSASLYELQSLDRLYQSLDAISDFVVELSKQAPPDWQIDVNAASRAIRLTEIWERVNGAPKPSTGECSGEFDCFESFQLTG